MSNTPWFDPNRTVLGKTVPLATPLAVTVTPSSICNFRCSYCMQSVEHAQAEKKGFKFQFMPEDLYKKLLDDLQEFPDKLKKLEFL